MSIAKLVAESTCSMFAVRGVYVELEFAICESSLRSICPCWLEQSLLSRNFPVAQKFIFGSVAKISNVVACFSVMLLGISDHLSVR